VSPAAIFRRNLGHRKNSKTQEKRDDLNQLHGNAADGGKLIGWSFWGLGKRSESRSISEHQML
jgi:hypothetical protein